MPDKAFHEIQLNGKQLVFLFIAATVVAVVIFLCGVMVGRGVQAQRADDATGNPVEASLDPTAAAQVPPAPAATASGGASVASQETLTYPELLEKPTPSDEASSAPVEPAEATSAPAEETSVPPSEPDPTPPSVAAAPAPESAPATTAPATADESLTEPFGDGFVVQVAAVNQRAEADALARQLQEKGYPAFVTTPAGTTRIFRVRVGKYEDRREAESVAARLVKEEQFKPWITR